MFTDPKTYKITAKLEDLESCYSPVIMSGGRYDLKPSATSDEETLHQGQCFFSFLLLLLSLPTNACSPFFFVLFVFSFLSGV